MDNKKVKALFGGKPKMLGIDEVAEITGHEVGGVCPFGLKTPLPVYCDVSLKAFDIVVPAAGSTHSAVKDHAGAHGGIDRSRMGRRLRAQARAGAGLVVLLIDTVPAEAARPAAAFVAARGHVAPSAVEHAAPGRDWPAAVRRSNSNTARQLPESCGVFCRKQATIRPTSGIWSPQRRQTSGVQAICCSQVPRYSCDDAGAMIPVPPMTTARPRTIRCVGMDEVLSFDFELTRNSARRWASSLPNECGHATLVQTKKCEAGSATPPCRSSSLPRPAARCLPRRI